MSEEGNKVLIDAYKKELNGNLVRLWESNEIMRKELWEAIDALRDEVQNLEVDMMRRTPPWVTAVISVLVGIIGIAAGKLLL